jgi:RNA polymerase sigma factor (sigma-70 family)
MAADPLGHALRHLRRALLPGEDAGLTDGQLLECFVVQHDEVALDALIRRHAAMVWGVCRRLLGRHHDAEDAFQATFLVLVRRAAVVSPRQMVGNWLYGVARQTALKTRATLARQGRLEAQMTEFPDPETPAHHGLDAESLRRLDQAVSGLPDKYRVLIVLCDLEGKTRQEVARQLGCPEGTVAGRLARARALLAKRLTRQGVALSAALVVAEMASAVAPPALVTAAVQGAATFAGGSSPPPGAIAAPVLTLTEGVLQAMWMTKLNKVAVALLVVLGLIAVGGGVLAYQGSGASPAPSQPEAKQPPAGAQPAQKSTNDAKVRELLKERLATLKELVIFAEKAFQSGRGSPDDVAQARIQVARTELELCDTNKERVAVHERIVAFAKEWETAVKVRYDAGQTPVNEVLKARVFRLDAEIDLERARAKIAEKAK